MAKGLLTLLRVFLMNSHLGHEEVTLCFGALRNSCCLLRQPSVATVSLHASTLVLPPFLQELAFFASNSTSFVEILSSKFIDTFVSKFQDFSHQLLLAFHRGHKFFPRSALLASSHTVSHLPPASPPLFSLQQTFCALARSHALQ